MIYRIPLTTIGTGSSPTADLTDNMFIVWATLRSRSIDPEEHQDPKRWGFDSTGDPLEFAIIGTGGP